MADLVLRPPTDQDLEHFFRFQLVPEANQMAAFTVADPSDREGYIGGWQKKLQSPTVTLMTVVWSDQVVGSVGSFEMFGQREVTYWLGQEYWGRGLATRALAAFLQHDCTRPLQAHVAKHNLGSVRVLEKCGFQRVGAETGFSQYLQKDVEEWVYRLD